MRTGIVLWPRFVAIAVSVSMLAMASAARATTPVTCAGLQGAIDSASNGELLQLPAGACATNVTVTNAASFTLEGTAPGTTLTPAVLTSPIISGTTPISGGLSFTLTDLTFTGATNNNAVSISDPGEAVTLSYDTFVGNKGTSAGSAVDIYSSTATTTQPTVIDHDVFGAIGDGNSSEYGGAVYLFGSSAFQLVDNTFVGNSATSAEAQGGGGLAIFNYDGGGSNPVTVLGNTFGGTAPGAGNTAEETGGAASIILAHGQTLTVDHNQFIDNALTGTNTAVEARTGGALTVAVNQGADTGFQVSQADNVFLGNVVDETESTAGLPAGGGGEWVYGVTVHSTGDVFEDNRVTVDDGRPPEGGGLGVLGAPATTVPDTEPAQPGVFVGANDLFLGNSVAAGGWGGAIYTGYATTYCSSGCPASSLTLQDSTVSGNSVAAGAGSEGGAIWGSPGDSLAVQNSIVQGNTPQPEIYGYASTAFAYSDVCNESGGPTVSGPGLICANPLLNSNGSETASSPTIDTGSNALVPAGLTTDVAGNPRITAGRCGDAAIVDMGAFEYPAPNCTPPPQTTTTTIDNQRITLTTPSPLACVANTGKLVASFDSTKITDSTRAKLKFWKVEFFVAMGVKHSTHKTVRGRNGKKHRERVTVYLPNATKDHVPVTVDLSRLAGLKGTHTLKVVVFYKETKREHGHKRTVTVEKTLRVKFSVC